MNRTEIEIKLSKDRAWILERLLQMSEDELYAARTRSEHDPEKFWSYADHFVHTTLIERDWNAMFRRHINGEQGMTTEFRGEPGSPPPDMATIMQRVIRPPSWLRASFRAGLLRPDGRLRREIPPTGSPRPSLLIDHTYP